MADYLAKRMESHSILIRKSLLKAFTMKLRLEYYFQIFFSMLTRNIQAQQMCMLLKTEQNTAVS